MKKALIAAGSLFLSSLVSAQSTSLPTNGWFWIEGKTLTLAYTNTGAPGSVSNATMLEALAKIEARLEGLNIPGLEVAIDTNVRNTTCDDLQRNQVLFCWGTLEPGYPGAPDNKGGMEGTTSWRLGKVLLDKNTSWSPDFLYSTSMHELMHVLGFQHPDPAVVPPGNSVLNGANDLKDVDTSSLRAMYNTRCVYMYNPADKTVVLPYVSYKGNAYNVTVHNDGNNIFSLAKVAMWSPADPPTTPCQSLAVDGTNQLHVPAVNVGGVSVSADLALEGGRLVLKNSRRN
jgi:hypothetical protein